MIRREFLKVLSALPMLGWLRPRRVIGVDFAEGESETVVQTFLVCGSCGKKFRENPITIETNGIRRWYCSQECYDQGESQPIGGGHPIFWHKEGDQWHGWFLTETAPYFPDFSNALLTLNDRDLLEPGDAGTLLFNQFSYDQHREADGKIVWKINLRLSKVEEFACVLDQQLGQDSEVDPSLRKMMEDYGSGLRRYLVLRPGVIYQSLRKYNRSDFLYRLCKDRVNYDETKMPEDARMPSHKLGCGAYANLEDRVPLACRVVEMSPPSNWDGKPRVFVPGAKE